MTYGHTSSPDGQFCTNCPFLIRYTWTLINFSRPIILKALTRLKPVTDVALCIEFQWRVCRFFELILEWFMRFLRTSLETCKTSIEYYNHVFLGDYLFIVKSYFAIFRCYCVCTNDVFVKIKCDRYGLKNLVLCVVYAYEILV